MAFISTGTALTIGLANSTNVFTANMLSINLSGSRPGISTATMATTDAAGTNSITETMLPGKLVNRTVECEIDFDPTALFTIGANSLFEVADASKAVTITWSTSPTDAWTANGFVTDVGVSSGLDERVQASLSIQLAASPSAGW